jgi:cell division protein FtsL
VSPRRRITKGEKLLWVVGIAVIFALAVATVSNQAKIYLVNHSINSLQDHVTKVEQVNNKLIVEKTKLTDPKRMLDYAKKHGYSLNIDNVKVIK